MIPYRGKRFWTHQIPTSCLPTVDFYTHWTYILYMPISSRIFLSNYWWHRYLPSIVAEKNVTKNVHICSMCIKTNQVGKQEVGIWRVQKRYPQYGIPRAPDNFQVQRVITPYFWKWCVFAYFLCTVELSTSEKIAYRLVRYLLPVCQLSWFLYTLNIYAHFSSHFSQQLLMVEIWYLITSFI
jgi:hypothetical protein